MYAIHRAFGIGRTGKIPRSLGYLRGLPGQSGTNHCKNPGKSFSGPTFPEFLDPQKRFMYIKNLLVIGEYDWHSKPYHFKETFWRYFFSRIDFGPTQNFPKLPKVVTYKAKFVKRPGLSPRWISMFSSLRCEERQVGGLELGPGKRLVGKLLDGQKPTINHYSCFVSWL